ncbi:HupE/UreJ family protein [Leisingera sp. ANG-DT]|uniref:HupE/UreJ family protein n=1 Tax=Leisingera sp. ANG-DT TaxID=1577897 RepID=UPI00057CEFA3|nr:HupE/UreJ family protein [Leisingera sp. ANG-DT]KIC19356.1 membrane protein [Leisingera sp. ANG-DT]
MNGSLAVRRGVTWLQGLFALLFCVVAIASPPARAHEVTPAIADFTVKDGQITLKLRLNVEAFVAGINLDGLTDTNQTAQAADYDELRALGGDELEPMVQLFAEEWLETFSVQAGSPVALVVARITIPEVGNASLPRASYLELTGEIPPEAGSLRITWPKGSGGVVLRQNGVEEPYTGYLQGGETSPPIPLQGGAAKTPVEAFMEYIPVGFTHILPKGLDHILFVLGLFFLSPRVKPLLLQVSLFTVAHTITLALGALGMVKVDPAIVEPLIALSIVFVAVENIFARKLHTWRSFVIFGFGLLHGLGFASVLGEFGLPASQFLPALIGFNVGVELGQLAVIATAYLGVRLWFGRHPKYRGRVAIPASVTIAMIGGYWFVERVFL